MPIWQTFKGGYPMQYHVADLMAVAIARRLRNEDKVFHGVASPLPMVSILLAKKLYVSELTYLNITGGVNVLPAKLSKSTDGPELTDQTEGKFDLSDIFDLGARGGLDVAFLSGVQIDGKGRLNSSVIGEYDSPKVKLPGGAGSAVLVPNVKRAFIWRTKHDQRSMVETVDFVTTQGNVYKVFTPLCIFGKDSEGLYLDKLLGATSYEDVKKMTGFEIRLLEDTIESEHLPTKEEMEMLQEVDPEGIRYIEF